MRDGRRGVQSAIALSMQRLPDDSGFSDVFPCAHVRRRVQGPVLWEGGAKGDGRYCADGGMKFRSGAVEVDGAITDCPLGVDLLFCIGLYETDLELG